MDIVGIKNIGSYIDPVVSIAPNTVTAPVATQQTGVTIDRLKAANGIMYRSAVFTTTVKGVLAAHKKLTIARKFENGPSTSTWSAYGTAPTNVVIGSTSATAAQTISQAINDALDLNAAGRYVRCDVTPTFSATSVDTCALANIAILGGADLNI